MQKDQCDAYVAAISLVAGNGGFILTESAENDIRPQVNSRQCFLGLAVALRSPDRAGWEVKVTYKDATRNKSYEVNSLEHVEVDTENRSLFLHCRAITGTLFIFGMTPYQNGGKSGFDLWNEAAKETRKWKHKDDAQPCGHSWENRKYDTNGLPVCEVCNLEARLAAAEAKLT